MYSTHNRVLLAGTLSNRNKMAGNNEIDNNNNNVWNVLINDFSDFLSYALPYITDRTVWNSIASSNKDMYKKSKSMLPPWPKMYRLPDSERSCLAVWCPDGTRVVYTCFGQHRGQRSMANEFTVVDQRYGIIHHIHINHMVFCDLKFSPDGKFLVSVNDDGVVRLWDNRSGNYEQLQEWNVRADTLRPNFAGCFVHSYSISTCSHYIVFAANNHVFVKEIENGRTIKSLLTNPFLTLGYRMMSMKCKVRFSFDGKAVFLCFFDNRGGFNGIKVWFPYRDDWEENVIILWQKPKNTISTEYVHQYSFSNDTTMLAMIYERNGMKGVEFWSIDNDYKCLKLKAFFQVEVDTLQFTQDDKYIVCGLNDVLWFWSVEENETTEIRHVSNNGNINTNLMVKHFSPDSQRLIVVSRSDNQSDNQMMLCSHTAS